MKTSLSDALKSLSPTIADQKILELAKTFENVTFQRSPNKTEYLKAYSRKLQQIRTQISEQPQQTAVGSPIVGSPQSQQAFTQGNLINASGAPVAAPGRNIPLASRTAAAAAVQTMVERIQSSRIAPNTLNDLNPEQKQAVKEQVNQMMPMYLKLDQLMPVFYALTNNRDATIRLILMKFMFQDQLDALKLEQYTITPENLSKLKERLQHYFMWVKTEMANNGAAAAAVTGATTTMGQVSGTGATAGLATGPTVSAISASGAPVNIPTSSALAGGFSSNLSTANPVSAGVISSAATAVSAQQPSMTPGPVNNVVKVGLTPADLKLPPPRKQNSSPPTSAFPASPRLEPGATSVSTPTNRQRAGSVSNNGVQGQPDTPKQSKALPAGAATDLSALSGTGMQDGQQQPSPAIPNGAALQPVNLETMTKDGLIQQHQMYQRILAGNGLQTKQMILAKMHLQKIQSELAKPHRQEQAPRWGAGVIPGNTNLSPVMSGTSTSQPLAGLVHPTTTAQQGAPQGLQTKLLPMEVTPQIKALQQVHENKVQPVPQVDPLEFLTSTYKTLNRMDEHGAVGDEVVARESMFMLHNTFEGFVGKRIGNGPGRDVHDEGPRKRVKRDLEDEAIAEHLLLNEDGRPDALMASYIDWADGIEAA
ncbi:hypothetical protein KVV02_008204 [Mortierella alpina]|uniref:Mediator complex subunit 15 KIX domain-containing protein n=1 Tax=Mortierella alpina TaxID=64518 RepID=A0A9P8A076_MORAP|nr:hypothetical protein KVV02_008204 [Mortierella alpina]